jgi:sugar O-acyltransferase (sialic acid O-acetyltransferase NeuD family)
VARLEGPADGRGFDAVAMAIGANGVRLRCLQRLRSFPVPPLVHPSAVVSASATLGRGTVVFAMAVVNADATVGDACIVNTAAVVEHDCVLGDGVHLSPSATLAGNVRVASCGWIGAGATVLPGVRVDADAVVGGGALVRAEVAAGQVVAGVPARPLRGGAGNGGC